MIIQCAPIFPIETRKLLCILSSTILLLNRRVVLASRQLKEVSKSSFRNISSRIIKKYKSISNRNFWYHPIRVMYCLDQHNSGSDSTDSTLYKNNVWNFAFWWNSTVSKQALSASLLTWSTKESTTTNTRGNVLQEHDIFTEQGTPLVDEMARKRTRLTWKQKYTVLLEFEHQSITKGYRKILHVCESAKFTFDIPKTYPTK